MREPITYRDSGVDIAAGDRMVELIERHVRRTFTPRVLDNFGGFAGLFRLDYAEKLLARNYRDPVLVGCTDGVGSKLKVAFGAGDVRTIGIDLVAMSVNDLICCGGEPLFFLDYIGAGKLEPPRMADIVAGIADGCQQADCALLGGETAELPDFYPPGEFDLAGFAVGVVERGRIIDGATVKPGDVVIGLASSGLHSNGYSLARRVAFEVGKFKLADYVEELGEPVGAALLRPTRIYVTAVQAVLRHYRVKHIVGGLAHITGSGLAGNIPRSLPGNVAVEIKLGSWPVPKVFGWLAKAGPIDQAEMFRVFNMGIGFVMIVRPDFADSVCGQLKKCGETPYVIGKAVRAKLAEVRFK